MELEIFSKNLNNKGTEFFSLQNKKLRKCNQNVYKIIMYLNVKTLWTTEHMLYS